MSSPSSNARLIEWCKESIEKIEKEIAELDAAANNPKSELELNAIGAKLVDLETELIPFVKVLFLAKRLPEKLDAVKRKIVKI